MKTRLALVAGLAASCLTTSAFAQEVSQSVTPTSRLSVGAQFELLTGGTMTSKGTILGQSIDEETDLDVAYGIGASLDYAISPYLSIGLAPRLVLNVINEDASSDADADKQLDLRLRVKGQYPVAPKLNVYGYLAPGYSILLLAENESGNGLEADDPAGLIIGGGVGATYDISPSLYASAELGYQAGFQSTELRAGEQRADFDVETSFFSFGLGLGARF